MCGVALHYSSSKLAFIPSRCGNRTINDWFELKCVCFLSKLCLVAINNCSTYRKSTRKLKCLMLVTKEINYMEHYYECELILYLIFCH